MKKRSNAIWLALLSVFGMGLSARAEAPVKFEEVFGLVRSNLTGVSEADLSKAAALGLIEKLQGKVELSESSVAPATSPIVAKTNTFDGAFAYVRLNRVASGVGQQLADAIRQEKKLKGVALDLRFAKGDDYAAVAEAVNVFLGTERAILKFGETIAKTSPRSETVDLPLVALVNRQTSGAAEALAGALREQQLALLIGSRTAGQALVFDNFTLSSGQNLRIARTKVELASGQALATEGLVPDLQVNADEKNERRWLEDPYLVILKPGAPAGPAPFLTSVTNRVTRRPNGAEIARRHRELLDEDERPETIRPEPNVPVVQDASLARALDFLKGVAAVPRLREGAK